MGAVVELAGGVLDAPDFFAGPRFGVITGGSRRGGHRLLRELGVQNHRSDVCEGGIVCGVCGFGLICAKLPVDET